MKSPAEGGVPSPTSGTPIQPTLTGHGPSRATLQLGFVRDGCTTRLFERTHFGPLQVQKPLYPEGPQSCHAVIVHPPGGVVGGDQMTIDAAAGNHTHVLLTTPGAAKWYRANGTVSRQTVNLRVGSEAIVEWLPQESIFFDSASVALSHNVSMAPNAVYIGSEILCLGRTAAGESFDHGRIAQRMSIRRGGTLIWFEQGAIRAGSIAARGTLGLRGYTVCAMMIAAGIGLNAALADAIRADAGARLAADIDAGSFGVSVLRDLLVARYLGNSSAMARLVNCAVWEHVRPVLAGRTAVLPRLWST